MQDLYHKPFKEALNYSEHALFLIDGQSAYLAQRNLNLLRLS